MCENILFIINYNSHNQIISLLEESDLNCINISHCIIYNNGEIPSEKINNIWEDLFKELHISYEVIFAPNKGYGAAVNACINLTKLKYPKYKYAFFSNADIVISKNSSSFPYDRYDAVGFPMYQNKSYIVSKISIFTPLIPFRFRKLFFSKPKFGYAEIVHGCFFGLRINFLYKLKTIFFEEYFLYWEETQFFYEINRQGASIGVSDSIRINHDGKKSVMIDNARYYMLRNGLYFYRYVYKSFIMLSLWRFINYLYALIAGFGFPIRLPNWYIQGTSDFSNKRFGKRII